jgi:glycosyltransferase involved in cell wall biosynthesis
MTHSSDFSVLMSVYSKDDSSLLQIALQSIIDNTIQPREIIIVSDGPITNKINSVISHFESVTNIRRINLPKNIGLAGALNIGLAAVTTPFTIRADSDDYNYVDRFEELLYELRLGNVVVGSSIRELEKNGEVVGYRHCPLTSIQIRSFSTRRNPFNHMSVGFVTSAIVEVGGYPNIYLKEDYALWAKIISKNAKVCNIGKVLVDATAGVDMFRRRGGIKYALAEISLQRHLVNCGIKNYLSAIFDGFIRSIIFLAPNPIREKFYILFLRKPNT